MEKPDNLPVLLEGETWLPEELADRAPDARIETGITNGQIASLLEIYYFADTTYVSTSGEYQNAQPYRLKGVIAPEKVREEYLWETRDAWDDDNE